MYDHLLSNNPLNKELQPMLADEWSVSPDANSWTFKLREKVPFHNGGEFTTKDVVKTWELIMEVGADNRIGAINTLYQKMGGAPESRNNIDVRDDHEFTLRLVGPYLDLGYAVSEDLQYLQISGDHFDSVGLEGYKNEPVGTGPFKFNELRINQYILYERFKQKGESHWWQIPDFDELQFLFVSEAATRLAMLLTEEADIAEIPPLLLEEAEGRGFKRVPASLPGLSFFLVFGGNYFPGDPGYNPANPFLNPKVRGAVNLAIDRKALKDAFFPGPSIEYNTVLFFEPFRSSFRSDKWLPYEYDPDLAKQLLAEAGYPDGLDIELWTTDLSGVPGSADVAEAIVPYLEAVGFRVKFISGEYSPLLREWKNFETSCCGKLFTTAYSAKPVHVHSASNATRSSGGGGYKIFQSSTIDELFDRFFVTTDLDERDQIIQAYGDHVYETYATVPLFWLRPEFAANPEVVEVYLADTMHLGPVRGMEFVKAVFK